MTSTHYRLLFPDDQPEETGDANVEVADGALVLVPSAGDVLRVPLRQIESSGPADGFTVRVTTSGGVTIELSRLGRMRTQLLAELRDARAEDAGAAAGAVGTAETFCADGADEADVEVYEDALLLLRPDGSERIGFSFVSAVSVRDYVITIEVAGRDPVVLSRLGRRTTELSGLLSDRVAESRRRTAAFVGALLPGLDTMSVRRVAGLLRDGVAAPAASLDAIQPGIADTLLGIVTLPQRREPVAELQRRLPLAIGFRQISSVRRAPAGLTPWHDHAITPDFYRHDRTGWSYGPGGFGWLGGGFDASYLFYGGYLGLANGGGQRPMISRPDMTRGCLTPATQDLQALVATGDQPTVLAFVLGSTDNTVVFEVVNRLAPVTWVYRAPGPNGFSAVNRALDDIGFAPSAEQGPAARISHGDGWLAQITALLGG